MHFPLLHISDLSLKQLPLDDPLRNGPIKVKGVTSWLADPFEAIRLAETRTRTGDYIALLATAVGSELVYVTLLGGLFSAHDRRKALSLAGVILPSVFVNQLFRVRFRFPRPPASAWHPLAFVAPGDFTFPSGHAQNAVVLGLFLATRSKRRWVQVASLAYVFGVSFSRVYLGVHYPRDVVAGAAIGLAALTGQHYLEKPFVRWWDTSPRGPRSMLVACAATIVAVLAGTPTGAFPLGVGAGLAVGHDLSGSRRFDIDSPRGARKVAQAVVGIGLTIGAGVAVRPLLKRESTVAGVIAGGLVGMTLSLGLPLLNDYMQRAGILRKRLKARTKSRRISQLRRRKAAAKKRHK